MDALDRMYQHLVRTVRSQFPQYETQPFEVGELHQTILPYRHHRRELGLDTNEDYEITLTELLSGARDYLTVDDRMRDTLRAELASPNPDPSAFKDFANTSVSLSAAALRRIDGPAERAASAPAPAAAIARPATVAPVVAPPKLSPPRAAVVPKMPTPAPPRGEITEQQPIRTVSPRPGDRCRSCNQTLPSGRDITFCPHCGQNLTITGCLACGSELELGWKFCPVCGKPAGGTR